MMPAVASMVLFHLNNSAGERVSRPAVVVGQVQYNSPSHRLDLVVFLDVSDRIYGGSTFEPDAGPPDRAPDVVMARPGVRECPDHSVRTAETWSPLVVVSDREDAINRVRARLVESVEAVADPNVILALARALEVVNCVVG